MKIDCKAVCSALATRLPSRTRWIVNGVPLDWSFSAHDRGLRVLTKEEIPSGSVDRFDLLIFGDYDYGEGGGAHPWLGIRKSDGMIYGLDVEREESIFLLNSSIEQFIQTFLRLHEYLGTGRELSAAISSDLQKIDAMAYDLSEWRPLVKECLL